MDEGSNRPLQNQAKKQFTSLLANDYQMVVFKENRDDWRRAEITSNQVRHTIESRQFTDLATNPHFSTRDFRAVPKTYHTLVPEYDVSLNQFIA